jgi:Transposase DDE domain
VVSVSILPTRGPFPLMRTTLKKGKSRGLSGNAGLTSVGWGDNPLLSGSSVFASFEYSRESADPINRSSASLPVQPTPFDHEVLRRLPLAEAILLLLGQATLPEYCLDLFDRRRELCYQRLLSFDTFVALIREALLTYHGSGRKACAQAQLQGILTTSHQAVYEKLAHVPVLLSQAFLAENTQRLRPLLAADLPSPLPASLRGLRVLIVDGKVAKRVAKRLKVLRGLCGGALGGKGLVVLDRGSGLVLALAADADGHANDAALVPAVVEEVRPWVPATETILWVGDSQFADLTQPHRFREGRGLSDHFLLRYNAKVPFTPSADPEADGVLAVRHGVDSRGRSWREEWGWWGAASNDRRMIARRITLERPGQKAVALVTDLLDADAYPAEDLLETYLQRVTIEGVFQKITEVFSLQKLISSRPKGTVFQLSFCLLLYNLIELVRGYVAVGQGLDAESVSSEQLFEDVQRDLTALSAVVEPEVIPHLVPAEPSVEQVRGRLCELLVGLWKPIWRKTVNKKRRVHPTKPRPRGHCSVQQVLEASKRQNMRKLSANGP